MNYGLGRYLNASPRKSSTFETVSIIRDCLYRQHVSSGNPLSFPPTKTLLYSLIEMFQRLNSVKFVALAAKVSVSMLCILVCFRGADFSVVPGDVECECETEVASRGVDASA